MKIVFILFFILYSFDIFSQEFCNTVLKKNNIEIYKEIIDLENFKDYDGQTPMIRLALHNVRRTNGTGGNSWNDIRSVVDGISDYFNPHNICFTVISEDNIDNDNFFYLSGFNGSIWENLIQTNNINNAIDIYFVSEANSGASATGFLFSGTVDYPTVSVSNTTGHVDIGFINTFNSPVLAHEIGHCLGLLHTHEPFYCIENIERSGLNSNCQDCGDLLCDTPSDFGLNFNNQFVNDATCEYVGTLTLNGLPYDPDTRNVMSYTFPSCMEWFTNGQGQRMRNFILNTDLFDDYVIPFNKTITGTINENEYYGVENNIIASVSSSNDLNVSDGNVLFEAGNSITFNSGFHVQSGVDFNARIQLYSCLDPNDENFAKTNNQYVNQNLKSNEEQEIFLKNVLYKLYPNPTNSSLKFDLKTDFDANISAAMYDMSGREIKQLVGNEFWQEGAHQKNFDISFLSDGIYMFQFCINENCFNEKVVKTR